jgi:hypothetical protein
LGTFWNGGLKAHFGAFSRAFLIHRQSQSAATFSEFSLNFSNYYYLNYEA